MYNKIPSAKNGKRNSHAVNPDAIRIIGGCPAIISQDIWNKVQTRLSDNKRSSAYTAKVEYLLSGKLACGKCGAAMAGSRSHGTYCYYGCTAKRRLKNCDKKPIEKSKLEHIVVSTIKKYLSDKKNIEKAADELITEQAKLKFKIAPATRALQARLREVDARIRNINDAISQGVWSASTTSMLKGFEAEQQDLYVKLSEIKESNVQKLKTRDEIINALQFMGKFETDSKSMLEFVDKVIVFDDGLDIYIYPSKDSGTKKEVPFLFDSKENSTSTSGARGGT